MIKWLIPSLHFRGTLNTLIRKIINVRDSILCREV